MAREDDLPRYLAAVHPRFRVPYRAEIAIAVVVICAVATVDLRGAIGFSSFGVLLYYFIANAAALRQRGEARRFPRILQILGGVGCGILALTLPLPAVIGGAAVILVGIVGRLVVIELRRRRSL